MVPDTVSTPSFAPFRDIPVDALRGFAIAVMVAANLVPSLLLPPPPFWLRLISSVAAPLFIFLAGMMVALSFGRKSYGLLYFLKRGAIVTGIAAVLDLFIRGMVPFIDMDVLYLIGVSLPLAYLVLQLGPRARMAVIAFTLFAAPVFRFAWGYAEFPVQIPFFPLPAPPLPGPDAILRGWFIDGWFPLFPWLAVSLLGAHAGSLRWKECGILSFAQPAILPVAGTLLAAGAALWYLFPGPLFTRYGYIELFYPPVTGFMLFVTGLILFLFMAADLLPVSGRWAGPLRAMGECSLAIYILHTVIIEIFGRYWSPGSLPVFAAGYLLLVGGMILAAYLLRYLRVRVRTRSVVLRMVIGG